jgi:O-antigen/teichoic acid export membrane protein
MFLARLLGAEGFGLFIFSFSVISVVTIAAKFGLDRAFIPHGAALATKSDWSGFRGLLEFAVGRAFVFGAGFALLISITCFYVLWFGENELASTLMIGALAIPFAAAQRVVESVALVLGRVKMAIAPDSVFRPLMFISLVLTLMANGEMSASAKSAMVLLVMAQVMSSVISVGLMLRYDVVVRQSVARHPDRNGLYRVAVPLAGSTLLVATNLQIDLLVVGTIAGPLAAGLYAPAARLAVLLLLFGAASANVYEPVFARLYSQGNAVALQEAVTRWSQFVALGTSIAGLFLLALGPWLLSFYGPEFVQGYPVLCSLIVAYILKDALGPASIVLNTCGLERNQFRIALVALFVSVVGVAAFVVVFGWLYAAFGFSAGIVIGAVLSQRVASKIVKVDTLSFRLSRRLAI